MSKIKIKIRSPWIWGFVFIAAAILIYFALYNETDVEYVYSYEKAEKGNISKTVSVSGSLDLFERVFVHSAIAGSVTKINTDYNEKITKDQLLLEIYSEEIVESFEKYADTYRFKQVDLANSRDLYETKKELFAEELISERELSDAKIAYQRMQSSFEEVKKEYERRKELLDSRKIYAPTSGIIINRGVDINQAVAAGTLLFEIAPTLEKMNLTINIDESDIGIVEKGQKVSFKVSAYPDEEFSGNIKEIRMSPKNINGITMYESLVICENREEKLKPGMSATATIHIGSRQNVLRVPNQAFLVIPPDSEEQEKTGVWVKKSISVANEMPVKFIEVEAGLRGDSYTEVVAGEIKKSDEVLISVIKEKK